jgi:chaperonin GroEL
VNRVKAENGNFGYNAQTDTYEDLMKAGVIDPTKVARIALENAGSIASLLLTTEAMITDKPERRNSGGGQGGGMPGGMGGMGGGYDDF